MTVRALTAVLVSCLAMADDRSEDRAMLAKAAAQKPVAPPPTLVERPAAAQAAAAARPAPAAGSPAASDGLTRAADQARFDVALAQARLALIEARQALDAGDGPAASDKARAALAELKKLAGAADVSVYELQAEGVLARAARLDPSPDPNGTPSAAGGPATARTAAGEPAMAQMPASSDSTQRDARDTAPQQPLDASLRAAGRLARNYQGADTPDVDTRGDAAALKDRTLANQTASPKYGYLPSVEIIDVDSLLARDQERYFYERALHHAIKDSEVNRLVEADEARVAPDGEISYPDDWPAKMAKRAKYKDGAIARSQSWTDKDGREWYMAVYDLHDLIYEAPDFTPRHNLNVFDSLQSTLNMEALRQRSQIFGGYAEDLAAGLPLLRYFGGGGVDDLALRGPKYDLARQQEIVEMIKRFTGGKDAEPKTGP